MERRKSVESFLGKLGGEHRGTRIFVGNNSLAAYKFIVSMQDFSYRKFGCNVFEFYGMERPSDRISHSKYLDMLTGYAEVATEGTEDSFKSAVKICDTAVHFSCEFVWPGWGHASEDPALPRECVRRGLIFIGPSESAMEQLGSKISANEVADKFGIESIPWMEISEDKNKTYNFCDKIGYPIMVKSPEGGGGKGIRVADSPEGLDKAIEIVRSESKSSEGEGKVFVTKYLRKIKHIELQLVADSYGAAEVVSSRDCTMQRRNQKLIEEGPAIITPKIEEEIKKKAKKMVEVAKYENACTVEFVYDMEEKRIYFLECNPRLQVEHTVTELLTGSNLCAVQWLISCGVSIAELKKTGILKIFGGGKHVVGARVIAESGECGFIPSTGSVFVSSGFQMGSVGYFSVDSGSITPYNDSQFGHVFGIGETREEAVSALKMALSSVKVTGEVKTLNHFLCDLIETKEFMENGHSTQSAEKFQREWSKRGEVDSFLVLCYCAISANRKKSRKESMNFQVSGVDISAAVTQVEESIYSVVINEGVSVLEIVPLFDDKYRVKTEKGEIKIIYFSKSKIFTEIRTDKKTVRFTENSTGNMVHSTVPGRIVRILKTDYVKKDEEYLEIESMKNLILIKSPKEGKISYKVEVEEIVEIGDVIAEIVGSELNSSVEYTDKIVYRNTHRNLTKSLLKGYEVPEEVQSYDKSDILLILKAYCEDDQMNSEYLDEYVVRSIQVLRESKDKESLAEFKDVLNRIKYRIARREILRENVKIVYELMDIIEGVERMKELEKMRELVKEQGLESALESNKVSPRIDDILLLLSLEEEDAERKKKILIAWAVGIFDAENSDKTVEVELLKKKTKIIVKSGEIVQTLNIKQSTKESADTDSVPEEDTAPDGSEEDKNSTLIEIEGTNVSYKRENGGYGALYENMDIRRVEAHSSILPTEITDIPNIALHSVLWNRRMSVYTTDEIVVVYCSIFKDEFCSTATVSELVNEIVSAYSLTSFSLPMTVRVHILDPLPFSEEKISYIKKEITKACFETEKYDIQYFITGIFEKESAAELFTQEIRMDRGFKESSLWINNVQSFYIIDSHDIVNTQAKSEVGPLFMPESSESVRTSRAKAKSLNTIYIYDAALLLSIFIKEIDQSCEITKIENQKNAAISGWRFKSAMFDFIFVGNDITVKNGAFSIDEDNYFSECASLSMDKKIPFIYVSSNSGAKIEVLESIKPLIRYSNESGAIYMEKEEYDSLPNKSLIEVKEVKMNNKISYEITDIIGEYGMGVENLSYSAQIAKDMATLYETVPTITYVTGRAVGIGAYLASIGRRIIQKTNSPIILTGFQALNSLVQKEIYKSNLEIGGPSILGKNGVVHKTVQTDSSGIQEILTWLKYLQNQNSSRSKVLSDKNIKPIDTEQLELLTPDEIINYISDENAFTEYLAEWAPNVRVGRTIVDGIPCGVIFPRTGTVHSHIPAPAAVNKGSNPSEVFQTIWTENVLLPESSKKIAQSIEDFSLESLPILILLNWKGFSAGHLDMFNGILQNGSDIVRSMEKSQSKMFAYLPPHSELRGGSWVVFDKKIGNRIKFTAHPTAKGSVIHPDGLSKIKCKQAELSSTLDLSDIPFSKVTASKLAKTFCALHDSSQRMIKMKVIDEIVNVSELKSSIVQYFKE
ncbi:acetyl-CoA carboxylase / biotin carboxylase 1 [Nematocida minor]|uniref:acetyl-CoA carboxylase / biotin carboxylase 1 n=1 Tax=Nematocida minor TaxID=1912983 RepID=UPI00221EB1E1|nr:acetyl-CoA carboxylase / biotin carboxylase 1 [Nematocida minor]KAI5190386.1 acetyl-CoA carboxylase / biotin carboxylase 1 [Nematocida minor]